MKTCLTPPPPPPPPLQLVAHRLLLLLLRSLQLYQEDPVYHLALSLISALYFYSINNKVESKFLDQNIDNMTMSSITYSNEVEGVHVFASVFVSVYDQDNWKKMWKDFLWKKPYCVWYDHHWNISLRCDSGEYTILNKVYVDKLKYAGVVKVCALLSEWSYYYMSVLAILSMCALYLTQG